MLLGIGSAIAAFLMMLFVGYPLSSPAPAR